MLDRSLQKAGLTRFAPQEFVQSDYQILARLVQQSLDQDQLEPHQYLVEAIPETLSTLVQELLTPLAHGEPNLQQLTEDLVRTVMRLRQVRITEEMNQLRYLQEELQHESEDLFGPYQELVIQYTQSLSRINRALAQPMQLD